jgi:hypothetical protein
MSGEIGNCVSKATTLQTLQNTLSECNARLDKMICSLRNANDSIMSCVPVACEAKDSKEPQGKVDKLSSSISRYQSLLSELQSEINRTESL